MVKFKSLNKGFFRVGLISTALVFLALNGFAQATLATVNGKVTDEENLALPGVTINFKNVETGYVFGSMSRDNGTYSISGIEPGRYEAEVKLPGFGTELRKGLTLSVGARLTIDFILKQTALEEEIIVTAGEPMVEISKSEISGVVNRVQIDSLPLLNRNFGDLSILQAGVQIDPTDSSDVRSNALPFGMGGITVDGVSNEEMTANSTRTSIPSDAVREFRVMVNQFSAEYGSAAGVLRAASTQSGTNEFRGRASFYYRDEIFDTPNYFVNHDGYKGNVISDYEKPDFKHLNPSVFLGGPLVKDKLHFFLSYEGAFRETYSQITSPLVPSETVSIPETRHYLFSKLNYQLNENNLFMFRVVLNDSSIKNAGVGGLNTREMAYNSLHNISEGAMNWTSFLSSSTMNELRVLYAWENQEFVTSDPAQADAFSISRPGGMFGKNTQIPKTQWTKRFQVVDNLSIFTGDHSLKFGFDYSYAPGGGDIKAYNPGYYIFATNNPFNAADPFTYPQVFVRIIGDTVFEVPQHIFSLFAQDSWAASDRLTLNFGVRYNYYTMADFDLRQFDFPANISPRFGFSWDPIGDRKTSIRGGVGTFSANLFGNTAAQFIYFSQVKMEQLLFPAYPDPDGINPFWSLWESILGLPPGFLSNQGGPQSLGTYELREDMRMPYALQASLGAQREVLTDLSLGVDFVYTRGYKLPTVVDENPVIPGTGGLRQDPSRGSVEVVADTGKSDFKGMYLTLSKRYSQGWSLDLSYTLGWSKANTEYMDSVDSYDEDGWERQYGPTSTDARHTITASGIVDLPFGIQLSGIVFFRSALPWTAYYGFDENRDTLFSDYLDYYRNSRRGFSHFWINNRLSKFFSIGSTRLHLFAEVYNLTNKANFINISANQNSPRFGEPTRALDPRQVQFGVRLDF
ncbi:MAG: TonB-dependent receptor [Acidobacteriota bacterium]|nr:TonB-dependent receptor [Acidobacteriota bacterium]